MKTIIKAKYTFLSVRNLFGVMILGYFPFGHKNCDGILHRHKRAIEKPDPKIWLFP